MRHAYSPASILLIFAAISPTLIACGDDDSPSGAGTTSSSSSGSTNTSSGGATTLAGETTIAGCPVQGSLIETTDWVGCVAGKSLTGTDPFSSQACDVAFDADGGFAFSRGGAVALTAKKADWKTANGTYQNEGTGDRRIFLASVAPELPVVEGQPRLTRMTISIFGLASQSDTIEIQYMDAALSRQTYNCRITGP